MPEYYHSITIWNLMGAATTRRRSRMCPVCATIVCGAGMCGRLQPCAALLWCRHAGPRHCHGPAWWHCGGVGRGCGCVGLRD